MFDSTDKRLLYDELGAEPARLRAAMLQMRPVLLAVRQAIESPARSDAPAEAILLASAGIRFLARILDIEQGSNLSLLYIEMRAERIRIGHARACSALKREHADEPFRHGLRRRPVERAQAADHRPVGRAQAADSRERSTVRI